MASTTVGVSPVARQSFEHGLSATVGAPPVFTVQLTWAPYPGADSYRVLRSRLIYITKEDPGSRGDTTYAVTITPPAYGATHYAAAVLPNNPFFFQVIAYRAGQALDTTVVVPVNTGQVSAVDSGPPVHGVTRLPRLNGTCVLSPSFVRLSWLPLPNVSYYRVWVSGLVDTIVTATALDRNFASTPPVGYRGLSAAVVPAYAIAGYPAWYHTMELRGLTWLVSFSNGSCSGRFEYLGDKILLTSNLLNGWSVVPR